MKRSKLFLVLMAAAAAVSALPQGITFSEALDGKKIPAVVKPKDLPADFWAVKITISGETSLLDLYGGAFAFQFRQSGETNEERRRAREALIQSTGVYWTKGEKVQVDRQELLICYRLEIPPAALVGSPDGFDTWAMENPLELSLQLIRPESIAKLTPVPSLSPEKMSKAVDAFQQTLKDEFGGAAFQGGGSMAARQTSALSNVKQLALGVLMYTADYDDAYPAKQSTPHVRNVTRPYMKNDQLWSTGNPNHSRFLFNVSLCGFTAEDVDAPAEMPMIYEDVAWPDGRRAVAFADGHAKLVSSSDWNKSAALLNAHLKHSKPQPAPQPTAKKPASKPHKRQ